MSQNLTKMSDFSIINKLGKLTSFECIDRIE